MDYFQRKIEPLVKKTLAICPVLGLTGPRQSGKSTLLKQLLPDYTYLTFDDHLLVAEFEDDPRGFIARFSDRVIFDEIQYVPRLFNYIKIAVDNDRRHYGKFVLTGSLQFSFMKNITESLAGRIGLLNLLPMQYAEIPKKLRQNAVHCGSYPENVLNNYQHCYPWYSAYYSTYINRDVRLLSQIGDFQDFQHFVKLLAANTSELLNMSSYANDIGVSVPTIKRWLSILEASYIIFLLPPYHNNLGKRLVKKPKVYFYDTGLVCYLTGIKTKELYTEGPMAGNLFENYVIADIVKRAHHLGQSTDFYFLRTQDGVEIDLVYLDNQQHHFIEIKRSSSFHPRMVSAMKSMMTEKDTGTLIYSGESRPYSNNIKILHYADYLDPS